MNRSKINSILDSLSGITYQDWCLIREQVDRKMMQKQNRIEFTAEDAAETASRMQIELEGYFAN